MIFISRYHFIFLCALLYLLGSRAGHFNTLAVLNVTHRLPSASELTCWHHKDNSTYVLCGALIVNLGETDEPWFHLCFHAYHQKEPPLEYNQPAFTLISITAHKILARPRACSLLSKLAFIEQKCIQIRILPANVLLCDGLALEHHYAGNKNGHTTICKWALQL